MNEENGVRFLMGVKNQAVNLVYRPPNVSNSNNPQAQPATIGVKYQKRKTMKETIKSKRTLHSVIKGILEDSPEDNLTWPQSLTFTEGMGEPLFTITIDKKKEDYFVDEKGQKWVKA